MKKILNRIRSFVRSFFCEEVVVLPSVDYTIDDGKTWMIYFRDIPVGIAASEGAAVKFCWKHWERNCPKSDIISHEASTDFKTLYSKTISAASSTLWS